MSDINKLLVEYKNSPGTMEILDLENIRRFYAGLLDNLVIYENAVYERDIMQDENEHLRVGFVNVLLGNIDRVNWYINFQQEKRKEKQKC